MIQKWSINLQNIWRGVQDRVLIEDFDIIIVPYVSLLQDALNNPIYTEHVLSLISLGHLHNLILNKWDWLNC